MTVIFENRKRNFPVETLHEDSASDLAGGDEPGRAFEYFSLLPSEIRAMVWEEFVGTPSCREKLMHHGRTYSTVSKTTEADMRGVLMVLAKKIPEHHTFYVASAHDEIRPASAYHALPSISFEIPTLRDAVAETVALYAGGRGGEWSAVVWPHGELTLEFPVHDGLRVYTRRRYFQAKGHFTQEDIHRRVLDFYWQPFTKREVETVLAVALTAHGSDDDRPDSFEKVFGGQRQDLMTLGSFVSTPQLRNSLMRAYRTTAICCITAVADLCCSVSVR